MSTFGPDPEHRFAFGLRATGPTAPEALGTEAFEPWEFVYRLGDVGAWGVGFDDDDLVPIGASPGERDDIVDKVAKALDSTGMVVSIVAANLSDHPVFGHGAFTSTDRDVRRYAIQKAMRAIDLGAELGAVLHELSAAGEGCEWLAAKHPLDILDRFREAVDFLCGYASEQGYPARFALRCNTHDGRGDSFLPTIGHALAFIGTLDRPEIVGARPADHARERHGARRLPRSRPGGRSAGPPPARSPAGAPARRPPRGVRVRRPAALRRGPGLPRRRRRDVGPHRRLHAHLPRPSRPRHVASAMIQRSATHWRRAARSNWRSRASGRSQPSAARALSMERFDSSELLQRRYRGERLEQLVTDLVLGLR